MVLERHLCLTTAFVLNGWLRQDLYYAVNATIIYCNILFVGQQCREKSGIEKDNVGRLLFAFSYNQFMLLYRRLSWNLKSICHSREYSTTMRWVYAWSTQLLFGKKSAYSCRLFSLLWFQVFPVRWLSEFCLWY